MRVEMTEPIMTAIPPPNTVANSFWGMLSISALTVEMKFDADAMLDISNGMSMPMGIMWMVEEVLGGILRMRVLVLTWTLMLLLLLGAKDDAVEKRDAIVKIVDVEVTGNDFIF